MAKCSQTSFSWEKLFIRVLHLVLTTFVITVLILKDTELRKSLIIQQWFYVLPYFAIVTASTVFYFVAGSVDPGFVASNDTDVIMVAYEKSKEDNTEGEPLISENCEVFGEPPFHSLPKLRRCGYCNLMQPLRSKHCEDCNRCVYRYDHHCPWLGNCVGERNHRYFWAFLLFETILIAWSIEIGWFGFQRKTLWSDWIYSNGILVVVMFILVIAVIVVTLLFGCHSYLIIIGRTTWEHMAHSKISYLKIFKEGENPFHEGYIKNVCKFMCHCRIRKWESIFHRSSINLGV